ncbi:hypothetical protein NDU88_001744 [Pleurodeles waltl]|uniref:PiggyBac transposable element-derived protein domain-containing protein n=1 Tax=Pleurodeles waltl TaxID=8319 RepID=A0AAV7LAN0_PLEWA|nr:hypothetical protein NDU88_001744 [Pleurodeles waltl]
MASRRMTAQQVVGMLFKSSSDHDYETDSASEAEEEVRDSGSEVSAGEESSDEEATLSADEGPVSEEDTDVPLVQQPGALRFPVRRPELWVAPNMEQPEFPAFTGLPGCRVNTENFLPVNFFELFVDDVFLEEIVEQTNLYAEKYLRDNAARLRPHSRAAQWIPTNLEEIKRFLGSTFLARGHDVELNMLSESSTGYVYNFHVYTGRDSSIDPPGCPPTFGVTEKIVWELGRRLFNKGHHFYVDNFYIGVQLFKELFRVDTVACGTIRCNRKGYPRELVCKKLERGQCNALQNDDLLALKFSDRRDVYMLSTIHDESTSPVTVWGQVAEVRKPVCILNYNKHMGGVHRVDQRLEPYTAIRKSYVWYKKLAIHLFHLATFNAFIVLKDRSPDSKMTFVKFQKSVIESLIVVEQARVTREAVVEDVARLKDRHFAEHIPPTPKKDFPAKKCRVCFRRGIRRETQMYCPDSPSKPGLCVGGCFKNYHTQKNYWEQP